MAATKKVVPADYPALCEFINFQDERDFTHKKSQKVVRTWKKLVPPMKYPEWFAVYYEARVTAKQKNNKSSCCTRYNHLKGRGCHVEQCTYMHACIVCGSSDHGAFFRDTNNNNVCPTIIAQEAEMTKLSESGFTEDDLRAELKFERSVKFSSEVDGITFSLNKGSLQVGELPKKVDLSVIKGSAEAVSVALRLGGGLENGGTHAVAGKKTKAIVFAIFY